MSKMYNIFFLFCLLYAPSLFPVVKGSQTAVSIEPSVIFPSADADNTMLGFGWFKNGFTLEDELTTCTFDSVYPVSGGVDLRGGTLYLNQDLVFKNNTNLKNLGTVIGNNHAIDFCSTVTGLGSGDQVFQDVAIFLNGQVELSSTVTFKGKCVIAGMGNELELEDGGLIVVDSGSTLEFRDMEIGNIKGKNIQCVDDSAQIVLHNINWAQYDDFTFDKGSIKFIDHVTFMGSGTFCYESSQTSTITSHGQWLLTDGIDLRIGRNAQTGNEPLAFIDETSTFQLENCGLIITSSGMQCTKGKIVFDKNVSADILSTSTDTGFIIGNGQVSDDCVIHFSPGTVVRFNGGYFTYNNSSPNKIESLTTTSRLIRGEQSSIFVAQDLELPLLTIELVSNIVPPMQVASGKLLSYKNSSIVLPDIQFDISSSQLTPLSYLLDGNDFLFFTKGTFPLGLVVQNANNKVEGNGNISGPLILQDSSAELTLGLNGDLLNQVTLNSGKIILQNDLNLEGASIFLGPGTVDLVNYTFDLPPKVLTWDTPIFWQGNSGTIDLHSKLSLSNTWTFSGHCIIDGNGNSLYLESGGELVVDKDSRLVLKNMRLIGVADNNIRCLDNESSIYLIDTIWAQDNDYTFTVGAMRFIRNNTLSGAYTFSYDSCQTSTIRSNAELHVTDGLHFYIGKDAATGNQPLEFTDSSSVLRLDNCSFVVPPTGIQLTKGAMILDREIAIDVQSTSTMQGVVIGTGQAADDFTVYFGPSVALDLKSGHFTYNNSSPTTFKSASKSAHLIRREGSYIYVAQDVELPAVTIDVESNFVSPMQVAPGKQLSYKDSFIRLPSIEFDITCNQLSAFSYQLDGNDSLFFTKGTLPLALVIQSTGNLLRGNGNISGPIILQDSSAELTLGIVGEISNTITLNSGKIILDNGLLLRDGGIIVGPGNVDLATNSLDLPEKSTVWSTPVQWQSDGGKLDIHANISLSQTWTISGKCIVNGNGNALDLSGGGAIVIDENSRVEFKNLRLHGVAGNNIRCVDDTGSVSFATAQLLQTNDFNFSNGSLEFIRRNELSGPYTFSYDSAQTSTLRGDSRLVVNGGMKFSVGRKTVDSALEPLFFDDSTAELKFDNSIFSIKSTGLRLTRGTVIASRDVEVEINSTSTANALAFGDGTVDGNMQFLLHPGVSARFTKGDVLYDITTPDGIKSKSNTARLVRGAQSTFHLRQNVTLADVTAETDPLAVLNIDSGKALSYNNSRTAFTQGTFDLTGTRYNFYTTLLAGNDSINLINGSLPLHSLVQGTGNKISGTGNIDGLITLQDSGAELISDINGLLGANIVMNNGTLILARDLFLSNDVQFVGDGTVKLQSNNIHFGKKALTFAGELDWIGSDASLNLYADTVLSGSWTFHDTCNLDGQGHVIDLSTSGGIVVDTGATVQISNVALKNISGTNIRCLGDDSVIVLDGVTWLQDGDYTFTVGALRFNNKVKMQGPYTFAYQSAQTSTLLVESQLKLDSGFTFSYDPIFVASKDLFAFEDNTAELALNSATLHATTTGMNLTSGRLLIKGKSYLASQTEEVGGDTVDRGIALGDETVANDCVCELAPGAMLNITQGSLRYKNVDASSWIMGNDQSVFYICPNTALRLHQSLQYSGGIVRFDGGTSLYRAVGKKLLGSVETVGVVTIKNLAAE